MVIVLSWINLLVWATLLVWLAKSVLRGLRGNGSDLDKLWALFWFVALAQVGYRLRFLTGIADPPEPGAAAITSLGLMLLTTGIGLSVMWKRHVREGWRW